MESAGAAEPSSENDSIHSFTLKSGLRISAIANSTAGCLQIRKEFSHSHSWKESTILGLS